MVSNGTGLCQSWRTGRKADNYYVKVGGVWKTGTEIHAKVSSTWEGGASTMIL